MEDIKIMEAEQAEQLELDPLSELTMTYTAQGFTELVEDIRKNGLLVPIILRNGKVLDGRHRRKACVELGLDIKYREVDALGDDDALDLVISNSINKATGTDASKVEAYLLCKAKNIMNKDMPDLFNRLNKDYVKKLSYIEKQNLEYLRVLLRQNSVRLYNKKYEKTEDYGTINGVWRTLKDNAIVEEKVVEISEPMVKDIKYEIDIEDIMVNSAAEQEFWHLYDRFNDLGVQVHPASYEGKYLISLINSKYDK